MRSLLERLWNRILLWFSSARRRHALVGPPRLWKLKRDFQFSVLIEQGLRPEDDLLDIGCGTLRGGIPLIRYLEKGKYCGLDVRFEVLQAALKELGKHGLEEKKPQLIAADVTELSLQRSFDFVWAFSVFIHLDDDQLERCFHTVARHLRPDGQCLGNVNVGDRPRSSWRKFPVVTRPEDFYLEEAERAGLRMIDLGSLREHGHESGVEAQDEQRLLKLVLASGQETAALAGSRSRLSSP